MTGLRRPPVVDINTARADSFVGGDGAVARYEPEEATSALAYIDRAEQALKQASTIDVVKGIRDQAEALRLFAKQAQRSFEIQNRCAEIKLMAERKAGLMLIEQDKNKGAAAPSEVREDIPRLKDLGISYSQSSRWQAIAGIPEVTFEHQMDRLRDKNQEITSAIFLKLAAKLTKERNQAKSGQAGPDSKENESHCETPDQPLITDFKQTIEHLGKVISRLREGGWQPIARQEVLIHLHSLLELVQTGVQLDR